MSYFVGAFQALPKLTVKFGEQLIRVYGDTAVNTGGGLLMRRSQFGGDSNHVIFSVELRSPRR
jgi:hypothetical protein